VAYLAAGYVIFTRFFQTNLLRVVGLVLWLANPYLAEFLALSRGYGMSAALEAAAICFGALYLSSPDSPKRRTYLRGACVCAILVVWANFATLHFFGLARLGNVANPPDFQARFENLAPLRAPVGVFDCAAVDAHQSSGRFFLVWQQRLF
jgi:hypothetical protein